MRALRYAIIAAFVIGLALASGYPARAASQRTLATGGLPDLVAAPIQRVFVNGQWFLALTVSNMGSGTAGSFHLALRTASNPTWEVLLTGSGTLAPGAARTFYQPTACGVAGSYFVVDSSGVVHEANEANNTSPLFNWVC